jgi:hypothetical protein
MSSYAEFSEGDGLGLETGDALKPDKVADALHDLSVQDREEDGYSLNR